ncbi:MAG: tetraacyldisaccharide 4'-kinase [Rhodospirillaceae bacterium]|nr:MAG: tetraacyldisaccharide 4'-kinase [Rhodospirillaceae bacterium]
MRTPEFWCGEGPLTRILEPFGLLYGAATAWRLARTHPQRVSVPVVCVGNLVAGGAGKTPVALAVARHLRDKGRHPVFLSRGHGGTARGPLRVDPARDGPERVGDEALLLAAEAPTIVARLRAAGARLAVAEGAEVIVMDDGHQNPGLYKNVALVVVDGGYGFGNGRLLPAGPLREPVARGLARASAVVLVGEDRQNLIRRFPATVPVLRAHLVPGPEAALLAGRRVVAFAGIGRPEKFLPVIRSPTTGFMPRSISNPFWTRRSP